MLNSTSPDDKAAQQCIDSLYPMVCAHWTNIELSSDCFALYLTPRIQAAGIDKCQEQAIDLYLVCACIDGQSNAIRILERQYVESVLPSGGATASRDDLRQAVLERLLLRDETGHCRLEEYSGRSSLRAWLRVVTKRVYVNLVRGKAATAPTYNLQDLLEAQLVASQTDPELDYIRTRYSTEFKRAFRAAIGRLDSREVLMLRMHLVERASGAEMASLFGVSRATVVRWMSSTRHELLTHTRQRLQQELSMSRAECDSVLRLVMRQLDISLSMLSEGTDQ